MVYAINEPNIVKTICRIALQDPVGGGLIYGPYAFVTYTSLTVAAVSTTSVSIMLLIFFFVNSTRHIETLGRGAMHAMNKFK